MLYFRSFQAFSGLYPVVRKLGINLGGGKESMTSIEEKVKNIISEQLGISVENVVPEASFTDDLGADSLDQVELIMAMEEAFGITIPDEDAENITTVRDVIEYINQARGSMKDAVAA